MNVRRVSLVAPMLDEARHIEQFVDDIAAQDCDYELELIVADGCSTDGSKERLRDAAERAGIELVLLDNPKRFASPALNLCIPRATGELIVRLDCHTRYPPDYVRLCAEGVEETGAWNVGGIITAVGTTTMERAVACAYDSPFGGIGWTKNLNRTERVDADLVHYGAHPRHVFEAIGLYDEHLHYAELEDVCKRIRDAGGRVVLDPRIRMYYTPRGSFRSLFLQYYRYGLWKVAVTRKHRRPLSARSVAPLVFLSSLLALGAAALVWTPAALLLAVETAVYVAAGSIFAVAAVRGRRERWSLVPRVFGSFVTFHVAHGIGQANGWLRELRGRRGPWPAEPRCEWVAPSYET